jgi:hypothetical protein
MHLLTLHSILEKELIPLGLIQCLGRLLASSIDTTFVFKGARTPLWMDRSLQAGPKREQHFVEFARTIDQSRVLPAREAKHFL